jgi:hypothetical protein
MCRNIHLLSLIFSIGIQPNEMTITHYRAIDLQVLIAAIKIVNYLYNKAM